MYANRAKARRMADAKPGNPDAELIEQWLQKNEPTVLPPGYAQNFKRFDDKD